MVPTARALIPAFAALLAGCDILELPRNCTTSVEPAIVVAIYDAASGAPIAASASGYVQDGSFTDVLKPSGFLGGQPGTMVSRRAADERPGTYDVFVTHEGYVPWSALDVRAADGSCHVRTRTLHADLQPLAGSPNP